MKKLSLATVALASTVAMLTGCSSSAGEGSGGQGPEVATDVDFPEGSSMAEYNEAQTIRIGTKFDQPLFGLKNPATGEPEGFDVEIGKLIAAELGIPDDKIEWVETVSANREPFLQQDRVDLVLATYTINDDRKEIVNFGGPYYIAGQALMVESGNPEDIGGPADLAGQKVCSVEGSASSENIRQETPDSDVVLFDSYSKCADAVKNGQAVAMTTDNTILAGLASLDPDSFELIDGTFTEEPYGVGIPLEQNDMVEFVDDVLEKADKDGRYDTAWNSTAGEVLDKSPTLPDLDGN